MPEKVMTRLATAIAPPTAALVNGGRALLQRKCVCGESAGEGDKCEDCKRKDGLLQRRSFGGADPAVPPIVHEVLRSPGQPLDTTTRSFMEAQIKSDLRCAISSLQTSGLQIGSAGDAFEQEADRMADHVVAPPSNRRLSVGASHDFSRVRIHADGRAAESAKQLNAMAYTVGSDVVFGSGRYRPDSLAGRRLLAHELTHVVQQQRSVQLIQKQGADKPPSKPAPPAKPSKPAASAPKMPVVMHYVSKTQPLVLISGKEEYNRCGRDLWSAGTGGEVFTAASKIMKDGFGIELTAEYDDLGCIEDATVVKELNPLRDWIAKEVERKRKRKLDPKKTHMFLLDAFYSQGARDNTVGEVVEVGGNQGAITDTSNRKSEGRTLAHELGHTLDLEHPKVYGIAAQSEPDFATCAEGTELMAWGEGTCVSPWFRREALASGKESGRLQ